MHQDMNSYWRLQGNIVIVGLTGVGKTTIGKELASRLGVGFLDLDEWIEGQERASISDIFAKKGESYFRAKESDALKKLEGLTQHVVAIGSGALEKDGNWKMLQNLGIVVWLHMPLEALAYRLLANEKQIKQRPILAPVLLETDKDQRYLKLIQILESLLARRKAYFKEARISVVDSASTPKDCSAHIHSVLERVFLKKPKHHYRTNHKDHSH